MFMHASPLLDSSLHLFCIQARDSATFPIATRTEVTIVVDDVNDVQPFFLTSPAVHTIAESTAVGTSVG